MSRKMEIPNLQNLFDRYRAGESVTALCQEAGISYMTFTVRRREAGIPNRKRAGTESARKVKIPKLDDLLQRYVAGESENKLACEAGITRGTFRNRLLHAGIAPRSQSEAEAVKWERMSPEQRAAQTAAANEASRGRKISWSEQCNQAIGRQRAGGGIVPVETMLAKRLRRSGLEVTQQLAIGIYNVDIAVHEPCIAVEIFGGGWHAYGRHKRRFLKRTKYLLDQGWSVVIIWVDGRRYPLGKRGGDYVISLADELRRNPPERSQYRVILGDGNVAPAVKSYFNDGATIERLGCG